MTQEEKVATNTKTPEEKDNAILQNELLSKNKIINKMLFLLFFGYLNTLLILF